MSASHANPVTAPAGPDPPQTQGGPNPGHGAGNKGAATGPMLPTIGAPDASGASRQLRASRSATTLGERTRSLSPYRPDSSLSGLISFANSRLRGDGPPRHPPAPHTGFGTESDTDNDPDDGAEQHAPLPTSRTRVPRHPAKPAKQSDSSTPTTQKKKPAKNAVSAPAVATSVGPSLPAPSPPGHADDLALNQPSAAAAHKIRDDLFANDVNIAEYARATRQGVRDLRDEVSLLTEHVSKIAAGTKHTTGSGLAVTELRVAKLEGTLQGLCESHAATADALAEAQQDIRHLLRESEDIVDRDSFIRMRDNTESELASVRSTLERIQGLLEHPPMGDSHRSNRASARAPSADRADPPKRQRRDSGPERLDNSRSQYSASLSAPFSHSADTPPTRAHDRAYTTRDGETPHSDTRRVSRPSTTMTAGRSTHSRRTEGEGDYDSGDDQGPVPARVLPTIGAPPAAASRPSQVVPALYDVIAGHQYIVVPHESDLITSIKAALETAGMRVPDDVTSLPVGKGLISLRFRSKSEAQAFVANWRKRAPTEYREFTCELRSEWNKGKAKRM